jgi:uncharacterized membrane protein YhaH (DUF805 family)
MFSKFIASPLLSFDGRIGRKKFIFYFIAAALCFLLLVVLGYLLEDFETPSFIKDRKYILFIIAVIICLPFVIFVTKCIERCHDLGVTFFYTFIPFFFVFMFLTKGQNCRNEFGEDPIPKDASKITLLNRIDSSVKINQTGVFKIMLILLFLLACSLLLIIAIP